MLCPVTLLDMGPGHTGRIPWPSGMSKQVAVGLLETEPFMGLFHRNDSLSLSLFRTGQLTPQPTIPSFSIKPGRFESPQRPPQCFIVKYFRRTENMEELLSAHRCTHPLGSIISRLRYVCCITYQSILCHLSIRPSIRPSVCPSPLFVFVSALQTES